LLAKVFIGFQAESKSLRRLAMKAIMASYSPNSPASTSVESERILVVGGGSFIGQHMIATIGSECCVGTWHSKPMSGGLRFDALKDDLVEAVPDLTSFAHAMVLYGNTDLDDCARNYDRAWKLNVESTRRVIDRLIQANVPFTFTSSESVFDGNSGPYEETSAANPIMAYGRQKLEVETYLRDRYPDGSWTILRLGKVFGSTPENEKLFTGWLDAINSGRKIRVAIDQIFSPIFVDDVVKACIAVVQKKLRGLYHLCGMRAYSRLDLLNMLIQEVERYRPVTNEIDPCSIDDFNLFDARPKNTVMIPDKFIAASGLAITSTEVVCRRIVDAYFDKRG
jgi:dTDP-4-dehydrorhamnose reductase